MEKEQPFENLFGQVIVKKRLNFYLEAFAKTSLCPFLAFIGAKGLGKTEFARQFAHRLNNQDGSRRKYLRPQNRGNLRRISTTPPNSGRHGL